MLCVPPHSGGGRTVPLASARFQRADRQPPRLRSAFRLRRGGCCIMNPRRRVTRRPLVIDVETTGLDPARHACIEIGAVLLDESLEVVWEFSAALLPPPDAEIRPEAQQVHRIA